jgi:hypothetical protein
MLSEEKYLELHRLFYNRIATLPASGRHIWSEDHTIPTDIAQGKEWLIFHMMAKEFNQALKNELDGLMTNIRKLEAWSQIEGESQFDLDLKCDFCEEILEPVASSVLNTPYIVSQRFIFFSTMLLHQTRMIVDPDWEDGELEEDKIVQETLEMFRKFFEKRDNKIKPIFKKLLRNIHKIHQFSSSTGNYRNLYHHRIPRRVCIGMSSLVTRMKKDDAKMEEFRKCGKIGPYRFISLSSQSGSTIMYGLGGLEPIEISEILPKIHKQHDVCVQTFDTYWNLVTELVKIWGSDRPHAKETV